MSSDDLRSPDTVRGIVSTESPSLKIEERHRNPPKRSPHHAQEDEEKPDVEQSEESSVGKDHVDIRA